MHVPKVLVLGFLIAIGCAVGWLLHGAASAATPRAAPTLAVPSTGSVNAATALMYPAATIDARPNQQATAVAGAASTGSSTMTIALEPAAPAGAPAGGSAVTPTMRVVGEATTGASTVRLATGPGGSTVVAPSVAGNAAIPVLLANPAGAQPRPVIAVPAGAGAAGPAVSGTAMVPAGAVAGLPVTQPQASLASAATPVSPSQPTVAATAAPTVLGPAPQQGIVIPPFLAEPIFTPLPGAPSRGVSFMEWESYRIDVAGNDILVTADDSNVFQNRNGKLNANTGDTDASGLNVTNVRDSVILGTESADEAPYQTVAAAVVDLAGDGGNTGSDDDDEEDEDEDEGGETDEPGDAADEPGDAPDEVPGEDPSPDTASALATQAVTTGSSPVATATAVVADEDDDDDDDADDEASDFPYEAWVDAVDRDAATAVNTDDGTTLASGADALVIGSDGYDDNDIRAAGSNITITRDDGNVVLGGTGDVNAQIGDSEQGAVIMDVEGSFIRGGGAY